MFGKRSDAEPAAPQPAAPPPAAPAAHPQAHPAAGDTVPDLPPMEPAAAVPVMPAAPPPAPEAAAPEKPKSKLSTERRSNEYYDIKTTIFNALIDAIDLTQLAQLDRDSARDEIRDIVNEIIAIKDVMMSISEQEDLLEDICNDVLGYGPLEPLLARDDIADIMVNGADTTYIEVDGKVQDTNVRFRDNNQLLNICQRIVSQVGRRVDESSPICDARLPGRQPRQRHRGAAVDRWPRAHHS